MSNNTGLYFYSAVFQGNMALLALVGVFVVFKLQILAGSLQQKDSEIVQLIREIFLSQGSRPIPEEIRSGFRSMETLQQTIQALLDNKIYNPDHLYVVQALYSNSSFKYLFTEREPIVDKQRRLVRRTRVPFSLILLVIIVSLILLPFAELMHLTCPGVELIVVLSVIVLNIIALIVNSRFVFRVLKD